MSKYVPFREKIVILILLNGLSGAAEREKVVKSSQNSLINGANRAESNNIGSRIVKKRTLIVR